MGRTDRGTAGLLERAAPSARSGGSGASGILVGPAEWILVVGDATTLGWRGGSTKPLTRADWAEVVARYKRVRVSTTLATALVTVKVGDTIWFALGSSGVVARGIVDTIGGSTPTMLGAVLERSPSRALVVDPIPSRHVEEVATSLTPAVPVSLRRRPEATEALRWWVSDLDRIAG